MAIDTIISRFKRHAETQPHSPAMWYRQGGAWVPIDWRTYYARCLDFAGALLAMGYEPGDAVAIMGNNRPEWLIADVGAMMVRGVPAGIYQTSTVEQAAYIAAHCEAKVVVVEDEEQWKKIAAVRDQLPNLRKVVIMASAAQVNDPLVVSFDDFCKSGADQHPAVQKRSDEIQPDDLSTLIYTSGTTGPPKGVMLSAKNLAATAAIAVEMVGDTRPEDCVVSYLPLSHIAEQMFSVHVALTVGYPIWFCPKLEQLKEVLIAARPTLFLGVPRVWEKFQTALEQKLNEATGLKATIIRWSRKVGTEAGQYRVRHGAPSGMLGFKETVARRLFFDKLAKQVGLDRLRVAVSGAAPISRETLEFFLSCGIAIHEVYGQSEGTGPSTFNWPRPGKTKIGTVGIPIPRVDVKIAEDGEIIVRGPNVFLGYFKEEEATKATLIDGWLHSGDVGEFDAEGFLRITDRKKDLLITAGGKNVAPQNIEKLLRNIPGVGQAVVIGDRRKYLVALVTIDPVGGPALAKAKGWPEASDALARHAAFLAHVQSGVDAANSQLARYETVKKFTVLPNDFTLETGELTPTQKIKRKVVYEKYGQQIEAMYGGEGD
ncbi:MAG: long-chain fatty acid--CoA ligase [Deltaproteobacteria bacterium]|nr:long-chain fatty acid--CoA ligase [Deltaproteobacteria bacterium]